MRRGRAGLQRAAVCLPAAPSTPRPAAAGAEAPQEQQLRPSSDTNQTQRAAPGRPGAQSTWQGTTATSRAVMGRTPAEPGCALCDSSSGLAGSELPHGVHPNRTEAASCQGFGQLPQPRDQRLPLPGSLSHGPAGPCKPGAPQGTWSQEQNHAGGRLSRPPQQAQPSRGSPRCAVLLLGRSRAVKQSGVKKNPFPAARAVLLNVLQNVLMQPPSAGGI